MSEGVRRAVQARHRQAERLFGVTAAVVVLTLGGCGADENGSEGTARVSEPVTYVGKVSESHAYIALNREGDRVGGYVCDGRDVSVWLAARPVVGGREAELSVRRDDVRVGHVSFESDRASGWVELGGRRLSFTASPAKGEAGLYRLVEGVRGQPGVRETGWIVLDDGSEKGVTNITDGTSNTRTLPAPKHIAEIKFMDPDTDL